MLDGLVERIPSGVAVDLCPSICKEEDLVQELYKSITMSIYYTNPNAFDLLNCIGLLRHRNDAI